MRRLATALVLSLAVPAVAQKSDAKPAEKKAVAVQEVVFENDLIGGDRLVPTGSLVLSPKRPVFERFTWVRTHFNDKLLDSVNEM